MVRRLTNSIRPGVLASLLAKGEAQTFPHVLHHARDGRAKASTLMRRAKRWTKDLRWLETERREGYTQ
jgi:hypothetical protein